jgi:hypothetical protein
MSSSSADHASTPWTVFGAEQEAVDETAELGDGEVDDVVRCGGELQRW